jgi:cytochrome bd-type quinol oxidase subunit 2
VRPGRDNSSFSYQRTQNKGQPKGNGQLLLKRLSLVDGMHTDIRKPFTIGANPLELSRRFRFSLMSRWFERPYLLIFPLIGAVSAIGLLKGVQRHNDLAPFRFTTPIFAAAFGTLACSFWPYMIPFALTVEQAASPRESLTFMFWGAGLFVMPLTLAYTVLVYRLFRGRVVEVGYE